MDELMIERLSNAEDRYWSKYSLGGMYEPEEMGPFEEEEEWDEDDWDEDDWDDDDWADTMDDLAFEIQRDRMEMEADGAWAL